MRERVRSVFICCILVFSIFVTMDISLDFIGTVEGATLYVNLTGSSGYSHIQDAIDDANPGDTIFVYKGLYFENIIVDKSLRIIGEDKVNTIIDGTGDLRTVQIMSPNVHFEGFTLELDETDITGGFHLLDITTSYNVIRECIFNDVPNYAIYTYNQANFNVIENNLFNPNYVNGIRVQDESFNNNYIANNTFNGGKYGIVSYGIGQFWYNTIINNTFIGEGDWKGISPESGFRLRIENNTFIDYLQGIYLKGSSECIVTNNTIIDSVWWSIFVTGSKNKFYHNNFIDRDGSGVQIYDGASNIWNASYPLGGNFWSDYSGNDSYWGINQNLSGSDGIGDTNVTMDSDSIDHYPLMEPVGDFLLTGPVYNLNKDKFYNKIQTGIDDADTGNTLTVSNGTYHESIVIDKSITLIGEGKNVTFIEGPENGNVVTILCDWVNITEFKINGSGDFFTDAGVYIDNAKNCTINKNNVTGNNFGIYIESGYDNRIYHNLFLNNTKNVYEYGLNIWNLSYPEGGNYWDDWTSPDQNIDGFVDEPRNIEGGANKDWLPFSNIFMTAYRVFNLDLGTSHPTIQDAVDNADSGNTIYVTRGTYYENIFVNKTLNLICDEVNGTTIDGGKNSDVLNVSANWVNITGFTIVNSSKSSNYAGIKLFEANYCNISGNNVSNNGNGISLLGSDFNSIVLNIASYENAGINLEYSENNTICENQLYKNNLGIYLRCSNNNQNLYNNISSNKYYGFLIYYSDINVISYNTIKDTQGAQFGSFGIYLYDSTVNVISENTFDNNLAGILLYKASGNDVIDNIIHNSRSWYGISIDRSINNDVHDNIMTNCSIIIEGYLLEHWNSHYIPTSNTANGKPVYYWRNRIGGTIPLGAANIILANCEDIVIENQQLNNISMGIQLGFSSNIQIKNCNVVDNEVGIYMSHADYNNITSNNFSFNRAGVLLTESSYNDIIKNNIIYNEDYGFFTDYTSRYNLIYHNNFILNSEQVSDTSPFNDWHNGYPSGGNYWSDYTGNDEYSGPSQNILGKDGIGDSPHKAHDDMSDTYPLMDPFGDIPYTRPVHNIDKDTHYFRIQDAIDAADTGNTIFVENGTYQEDIELDKTINLIGEDRNCTIIDGGGNGIVVLITVDYVNITGFTINHSGSSSSDAGIYTYSKYNTISGNVISFCRNYGIYLSSAVGNILYDNIISESGIIISGFKLEYWNTHSIFTSNTLNGKPIYYYKNQIANVINLSAGQIILANCTLGSISHMEIRNCYAGIILGYSSYLNINNNIFTNNKYGIYSIKSDYNVISDNSLSDNQVGGYFYYSSDNNITNNTFYKNYEYGLRIFYDSYSNNIYHNDFIDNFIQATDRPGLGTEWNDNYPSGGNFWSDYEGVDYYKDPEQHTYGSDGIGDTPYEIISDSKDYYPLLGPQTDTTPPIIQLITPDNNSIIQPGLELEFKIIDLNYIYVSYTLDANPIQSLLSPYIIFTDNWSDGFHIIRIWAKDIFNNSRSNCFYFIIDSVKPEINLIGPRNGSIILSGTLLDFSIEDKNLLFVKYSVNNISSIFMSYPFDVSTLDWAEGNYSILIEALDKAGNSNFSLFFFSIDTSRPIISLIEPLNNACIKRGCVLNFTVEDENLVNVTYSVNGEPYVSFIETYLVNTTDWIDGDYTIRINAKDIAGNTNSSQYFFQIDSTSPLIIFENPGNNSIIKKGVPLMFSIIDTNQIQVDCSVNQGLISTLYSPYIIPTGSWEDGPYSIQIIAIDEAGNVNGSEYSIIIDTTTPTIIFDSPPPNTVIKAGEPIIVIINDPHLLHATYSLNGNNEIIFSEPFTISTAKWKDGEYHIQIQSIDIAGNWNEQTIRLTIDSTKPIIKLIKPETNSIIPNGIILDFIINDNNLQYVNYSINKGPFTTFESPYNLQTANWFDGNYLVEIKATDLACNINSSVFIFTIDNKPPEILFDQSLNHSTILPLNIIQINIPSSDVNYVEYSLDGGLYKPLAIPYLIFPFAWSQGGHVVSIRAVDNVGNIATSWFEINIDRKSPFIISTYPLKNAKNIKNDTKIIITFSEPMDYLRTEKNILITPSTEYTCEWDTYGTVLTISFSPYQLESGTNYTLIIGEDIADINGNTFDNEFELTFTTIRIEDEPGIADPVSSEDNGTFVIIGFFILIIFITIILFILLFYTKQGRKLLKKKKTHEKNASLVEKKDETQALPEEELTFEEIKEEPCKLPDEEFTFEEINEEIESLSEDTEFEILPPPPPPPD